MPEQPPVVIAVPKGRILKALDERVRRAGLDPAVLLASDRRLVRDDPGGVVRWLLLKPDDVPTYVEYGAADLGIVGRDVLRERDHDLYTPVDLQIGLCRMVVAGPPGIDLGEVAAHRPLRVASKYPNVAVSHFHGQGLQVETIFVQGSVELAPATHLADVVVDIVETGTTLRENGLVELETIFDISSVVVANRVGLKLKRAAIEPILEALRPA